MIKNYAFRYKYILLLLPALLIGLAAFAQNTCGTVLTDEQKAFEAGHADSLLRLQEINRTFLLAVYIVQDAQHETDITPMDITGALNICNAALTKIKVDFKVSKWDTIENYQFNVVQDGLTLPQLSDRYHTEGMINLYCVSGLLSANKKSVCAITTYPSAGQNAIFIRKDCFSGAQLAEQLGHFFNLYHTHEDSFGNELVSGSNCSNSGDLCCDTPADPNLADQVDKSTCAYSGSDVDGQGKFYIPTTANFMSAAPAECKCCFTDEQLLRMMNCMLRDRKDLW